MEFNEVKSNIEKISADIETIEGNEFDDLKDVELQESFIRELIFNYCVARKYDVEGFPFKQLKKIEGQEIGYDEDFLTWERMEYYIDRLALKKEDVFELRATALKNYYPNYSPEEIRKEIEVFIELAEKENLHFDLSKEEIEEATREVKPTKPRWPG